MIHPTDLSAIQMSKNAVDGEKATRYFNAVLRHRQGRFFRLLAID